MRIGPYQVVPELLDKVVPQFHAKLKTWLVVVL